MSTSVLTLPTSRPAPSNLVPFTTHPLFIFRPRPDEQLYRKPVCGVDKAYHRPFYQHGRGYPEFAGRDSPAAWTERWVVEARVVFAAWTVDSLGDADGRCGYGDTGSHCIYFASQRQGGPILDLIDDVADRWTLLAGGRVGKAESVTSH